MKSWELSQDFLNYFLDIVAHKKHIKKSSKIWQNKKICYNIDVFIS